MTSLDLQDPQSVVDAFDAGAGACLSAACRRGSIDVIGPPGTLIATGDLHDNPISFERLLRLAGLDSPRADHPRHLLLHEIIHSDRLINGMDFSYRALARAAALKAQHPEHVHILLANHELSQVVGAGIIKDGVRVVEAFNQGVEYVFGDDAPRVNEAIGRFIRALPLALRAECPNGHVLCAHSLPAPWGMQRFDPGVLSRPLQESDYEPRQGAAHLMVWGRGYDAEQLEDLVERWGVSLFVLGHEKAENGVRFIPPNAIVLNSDHDRAVYLPIDLSHAPTPEQAMANVRSLATVDEQPAPEPDDDDDDDSPPRRFALDEA